MKKTLLLLLLSINYAFSQESINYQTPSDEILDLVEYDRPPSVAYDRDKNFMLFLYRDNYKSIEDLSQKELRLAGLRINPKKNIGSRITYYNNVKIKNLKSKNPEVNDIIGIPNNPLIANINWSPNQKNIAFEHQGDPHPPNDVSMDRGTVMVPSQNGAKHIVVGTFSIGKTNRKMYQTHHHVDHR